MAKYLDWNGVQHLVTKVKSEISAGDAKSIKKVYFDIDGRKIKFFKDETTLNTNTGDFEVTIPRDVDISNLLEKLVGATDGNIIVANSDGTIKDGGKKISDLATKSELNELSNTKIGDISNLDTTHKTSIVGAINEIEASIDALQRGSYDDSELRGYIGTLGSLTTNTKDNLVNAINELDTDKADKASTLVGYGIGDAYTKTETDLKIAQEISNVSHLKREIKDELPDVDEANEHTIYMISKRGGSGNQNYDEYMLINGGFEKIGDSAVILTDYALKSEVATAKSEATQESKNYVDEKLGEITSIDTSEIDDIFK